METGSYTNRFPFNNHRRVQKEFSVHNQRISVFTGNFPFFPKPSIPRVQSTNSAGSQSHACALRQKGTSIIPNYRGTTKPTRCCRAPPCLRYGTALSVH